MVLIETLWNVKRLMYRSRQCHAGVLIETLWNVKDSGGIVQARPLAVLIETLWNVKAEKNDYRRFLFGF